MLGFLIFVFFNKGYINSDQINNTKINNS